MKYWIILLSLTVTNTNRESNILDNENKDYYEHATELQMNKIEECPAQNKNGKIQTYKINRYKSVLPHCMHDILFVHSHFFN